MLLPERSNWQAQVHDKFEESAQDVGGDGESGDAQAQPRQTRFRLAQRAAGEGVANELSNGMVAHFLCSSVVPLRAGWNKNSAFQGMFRDNSVMVSGLLGPRLIVAQ
jgi:hypothetical protein